MALPFPGEVYLHMGCRLLVLYVDEIDRTVGFKEVADDLPLYYRHQKVRDHRPNRIALAAFMAHRTRGLLERDES